jgi:hypothetical protein
MLKGNINVLFLKPNIKTLPPQKMNYNNLMKVLPKQWIVAPGTSLRMMAFALLVWGGGISAQTIPAYVPKDSLVGWWPFNGNANDESGNGNNGTVNGATLTSDRNGKANSAYSFDGINDYVDLTTYPTVGTTSFSVFAWINITPIQKRRQILAYGSNQTGRGVWFYLGNDGLCHFDLSYTTGTNTVDSISCNQWHFVGVVSNLGEIQLYLDGVKNGKSVKLNVNVSATQGKYFGTSISCDNWFYDGKLDDISIWNRALDSSEIYKLYNGCSLKINSNPKAMKASLNSNVLFSVTSNDSNATYQWQTDLGVGFQNLNNVGQYSGANTDTLLVSNVSINNDKQPFRCIVSSGNCKDTSSVAVLNIQNCVNGFQRQPANQNIPVGSNASWIATANDSNATYQWQTDLGVGFQNLNSVGQYSGATNDTLIVSNVTMGNHNQPFRCLISAGTCKDTSSVAVLTVNNPAGIRELVRATDFIIYPNPASTVVTIDFGNYGSMTGYSLRIVNVAGQTIYTTSVNQPSAQINLNAIAGKGLYFVQIINPQQKTVESRKLVIQ